MDNSVDYLVVGGGIAGASVASFLAPHGRTVVLERESQPGFHSTGRSAAIFNEGYGSTQVRALTRASRAFFESPPDGFADGPILSPRGSLVIATIEQLPLLKAEYDSLRRHFDDIAWLSTDEAIARLPVLRHQAVAAAIFDPHPAEIDVHRLHQGYLRATRAHGGRVEVDADVTTIERRDGCWHVDAGERRYVAPVLIDAAGAWADRIAALAGVRTIGLVPRRRSAFTFEPPSGIDIARWPMLLAVDESFYIKPDAGLLLGSPANADPVDPHDVQAEELDIAIGIDRIQNATTLSIRRPRHVWAGLRSFVRDGDLVAGFAPDAAGFFWVAAQGGYGVQTSAAMGAASAALIRGIGLPDHVRAEGIDEAILGPGRLFAPITSNDDEETP